MKSQISHLKVKLIHCTLNRNDLLSPRLLIRSCECHHISSRDVHGWRDVHVSYPCQSPSANFNSLKRHVSTYLKFHLHVQCIFGTKRCLFTENMQYFYWIDIMMERVHGIISPHHKNKKEITAQGLKYINCIL